LRYVPIVFAGFALHSIRGQTVSNLEQAASRGFRADESTVIAFNIGDPM
jgi:hypothetical protein